MFTMRRTVVLAVRICTGLCGAQQHRANGNVAACRCLEQVVGNVGGVDVGQHQQVGVAGQRCCGASGRRAPRRPARRRHASRRPLPARAPVRCSSSSVWRILTALGWLLLPKLECDSRAALGVNAEAHHFLGRHDGDFGQFLGGRVVVDMGVDQEHLAVRQHQAVHAGVDCTSAGCAGCRRAFADHLVDVVAGAWPWCPRCRRSGRPHRPCAAAWRRSGSGGGAFRSWRTCTVMPLRSVMRW